MSADLKRLTRIQAEILQGIIDLTIKEGCPPTSTHASKSLGHNIRATITVLSDLGYIRQAYEYGPWIPVMSASGEPYRLAFLPQDIAQEAESKAYRCK